MGKTTIEWTDESINPLRARAPNGKSGHYCEKVSPGCGRCYSSRFQPRLGLPVFQEQRRDPPELSLDAKTLLEPLKRRTPTKFFWCDMTDIFGEWVPFEWIAACFGVMAATPRHTHQVLTKRPERAREFFAWLEREGTTVPELVGEQPGPGESLTTAAAVMYADQRSYYALTRDYKNPASVRLFFESLKQPWPLPNVWLGVSVEDQQRADERIPHLLKTPAAVRFLSCEPLLGPVDLKGWGSHAPSRDVSHAPATWAEFNWPDWVPEKQRQQIAKFWSTDYSRGPSEWLHSHVIQQVPATGAHETWAIDERGWALVDKMATDGVRGRYLHLWNNIGCIITDDGRTLPAAGGHGSGWLSHWLTRRGDYASLINWVIVGGESGLGARPMQVDWMRALVKQCAEAKVACFAKQVGARPLITRAEWDREKPSTPLGRLLLSPRHDPKSPEGFVTLAVEGKGSDLTMIPGDWPREFPEVRP